MAITLDPISAEKHFPLVPPGAFNICHQIDINPGMPLNMTFCKVKPDLWLQHWLGILVYPFNVLTLSAS